MLSFGQATATTVATLLFTAPPGWAVVTVQSGSASTTSAFLGSGTAVTSSNGLEIPVQGATSWAQAAGSKTAPVYAITTAANGAVLSWSISSAE